MRPRVPTQQEREQLIDYCVRVSYLNPGAADRAAEAELVEHAAIAVFDHYITDGPGYAGRVMVVVWSGSPGFYQVFIWDHTNMIVLVTPEW